MRPSGLVSHYSAVGDTISCDAPYISRTKNQPKEEVFGTDIPRTSGGHPRGYPGPKLRLGRSKSWKNEHFGADIHDPKARTSTTLRGFQKLRSEKLWAEFSFPNIAIGFRGKRFLRYPSCWACLWTAIGGGVAAIVCNTTGNTVRQGYCYTCLAIGGYFGRVTKPSGQTDMFIVGAT